MLQISKIKTWKTYRKNLNENEKLGFIPTMGCLHKGHASLIENAKRENDIVVVSIFVNPTQFNSPEDLKKYPNRLEKDLEALDQLGVDYVFTPNVNAIYPNGNLTKITTNHRLASILEGKYRPGHFDGVLTVVMKLLQIINPNKVYFGEKDYQQLELIRSMVEDYHLDTEIIGCPTIREESGLAMSSRNTRLTTKQRDLADKFATIFTSNNTLNEIKTSLLNLGLEIEYLEEHNGRRFVAIKLGDIRLIDNVNFIERPDLGKVE